MIKRRRMSHMKRAPLVEADRIEAASAKRGETISAVVDRFLADSIRRASAARKRGTIPVFDMGTPRLKLADRDQLWEAMERE